MQAEYFKYPRTMHLPWSPGATKDDKRLSSTDHFEGKIVVVTEKLDGENTNIYSDRVHARSIDTPDHPTRIYVQQLQERLAVFDGIPKNWRVCGENVYGAHSIFYTGLPDWFFVFGIYNENNYCLSWEETKEWCKLLQLEIVPELYVGPWDEDVIKSLWTGNSVFGTFADHTKQEPTDGEGYVVRNVEGFHYDRGQDFRLDGFSGNVAKYVREKHVRTDEHWMKLWHKHQGPVNELNV